MTKLNFNKNTRVQVKKAVRIVAYCLAMVRIHGRERERERERETERKRQRETERDRERYAMYLDICYCVQIHKKKSIYLDCLPVHDSLLFIQISHH